MTTAAGAALSIRHLSVRFPAPGGAVVAVDDVSFDVGPGETVGVVGESGCGKTVTALAVLGLLPTPPGEVTGGQVLVGGRDLLTIGARELRRLRGKEVAMVFQDPMTALHPAYPVLDQVVEAVWAHEPELGPVAARARAVEALDLVGVPDASRRARAYPHEWSGGMRQRAMIAMAVLHRPRVLIADEPTTALDVTVQAQVLELLRGIQREHHIAIVVISHDLGVIAEMADRVVVMYAGRIVEAAEVSELFAQPRHPYTAGLLASLPRLDVARERLVPIVGSPPNLAAKPPGCAFHPRCPLRAGRHRCVDDVPELRPVDGAERVTACHYAGELAGSTRLEAEVDVPS
ncbi:MAG: ABC transporter ATP-binding protein [Actinobacteria bacterium]|nr:ABC transporter ATP-binding protein [Actinomycetota bacterium]